MAACRGLDVLLGASPGRWRRAVVPALTVAAHTCTVTLLSRREVTGGGPLLLAATLAGTAAIAAVPAVSPGRLARWRRLLSGVLAGWYAVSYGTAQAQALTEPSAGNMRAAAGAGITGLPALHGALIAGSGAPAAAGVAVAAAAPLGRPLARRLSPT